jgi:hypothetical protein
MGEIIDFAELRDMAKSLGISTAMKKKDVLLEEVLDAIAELHGKGETTKAQKDYYNKFATEEKTEVGEEKAGEEEETPAGKGKGKGKGKGAKAVEEKPEVKAEKVKAAAKTRKEEKAKEKKAPKPISTELNERQEKAIKILKKGKVTKENFAKQYGCELIGIGGIIGNIRRKGYNITLEDGKLVLSD